MKPMPYRPFGISKWADDLFESFFNRPVFGFDSPEVMFSQPSVNVREEETEFVIEVAAPGLSKEDFRLEVEQGNLIIRGEKESKEEETREGKYTRREFNYAQFARSFHLPDTVNAEAISAKYENGVLHVYLPKVEAAVKPSIQVIDIQ